MKLFFEIFISFGPLFLGKEVVSYQYAFFKVPRYFRLFELEQRFDEYVEYFRENNTLSETNLIKQWLDLFEFMLSTILNLHLLTCIQIIVCQNSYDFSLTWMGNKGID